MVATQSRFPPGSLTEHEGAVEAAMAAIRRHTEQIEALEAHIKIVREALSSAIEQAEGRPVSGEIDEPVTQHAIQRPTPPPPQRPVLRPVPPPPAPPPHYHVG